MVNVVSEVGKAPLTLPYLKRLPAAPHSTPNVEPQPTTPCDGGCVQGSLVGVVCVCDRPGCECECELDRCKMVKTRLDGFV